MGLKPFWKAFIFQEKLEKKKTNMWRGAQCEILKPYDLLSHQECVLSAFVHFINTCQVVSTDIFFKEEFSCFGTTPNFWFNDEPNNVEMSRMSKEPCLTCRTFTLSIFLPLVIVFFLYVW